MKKSMKLIAVVMVALMLCLTLASCGKTLAGKYENDLGILGNTTYEFSGKTVKISYKSALGTINTIEGEYEIDDDQITFTFADDEEADSYDGTFEFEEKEDSIVIGKIEYEKVEK